MPTPQSDPFAEFVIKSPSAPSQATEDPFAEFAVAQPPASTPAPKGQRVDGASFADKLRNAASLLSSGAIGAAKGAGRTILDIGEMAIDAGMVPGQVPNIAQRSAVAQRLDKPLEYANTAERVGGAIEGLAELAIPVGHVANAVPRAARAAGKFQNVMGAAKNIAIDPEAPGQVGLRIAQIAERGGGNMPRPVSQFLQWVTNPERPPMTYEVARDFASGISRLSANETMRLSPVMQREVAELRVVLNKSVADAANKAGKGKEYADAMTEYAKAMKLRKTLDDVVTGAKRAVPIAGAAGAATWLTNKVLGGR